jgi:hypothetical protein
MKDPDQAEWSWIRPHAERDAVILVAPGLQLTEVAQVLSANQSKQVAAWISEGRLSKPSQTDLQSWNQEPTRLFWCLVVQPFVLIQRLDS